MDDSVLRIMQLGSQGLCCSQILMKMALEDMGEENIPLIRALSALCEGVGSCGLCGAASGGACVIALFAAKGDAAEEEDIGYKLMLDEFMTWFRSAAPPRWGGIRCDEIITGSAAMESEKCGDIIVSVRNKVLEIVTQHGFDPSMPR